MTRTDAVRLLTIMRDFRRLPSPEADPTVSAMQVAALEMAIAALAQTGGTCQACAHSRIAPRRTDAIVRWCANKHPVFGAGTVAPVFGRRVPPDFSCALYQGRPDGDDAA